MRHLRLVQCAPREVPPLDRAVAALLEHGRIVPPLPDIVRARAIARARAAITADPAPATPTTFRPLRLC